MEIEFQSKGLISGESLCKVKDKRLGSIDCLRDADEVCKTAA
jgi:hypothetical protein